MKDRIDFIQALRGIAAVYVMCFHALPYVTAPLQSDIAKILFQNGAAGVDLFFVISGFIMVYTTWGNRGGSQEAARFWLKRLWRIWPLYAVATLAYVAFVIVRILDRLPDETITGTLTSLLFFPGTPVYGIGWTLNIEMYFYTVFAVALIAGRARWLVLGVWAAVTVWLQVRGIGPRLTDVPVIGAYAAQAIHPCIGSFMYGMLIAIFHRSDIRMPAWLARSALALSVSFLLWQCLGGMFARLGALGYGAGFGALVLSLSAMQKAGCGWQPPRLMVWLGQISYSLYLTHAITLPLVTDGLKAMGFGAYTASLAYLAFLCVVTVLISSVVYRVFEAGLFGKLPRGFQPQTLAPARL